MMTDIDTQCQFRAPIGVLVPYSFFRVFGQVKMTVLLGFTVAAYNLDRVRSFRAKHNLENDGSPSLVRDRPIHRSKRRDGTWVDIIETRSKAPPK